MTKKGIFKVLVVALSMGAIFTGCGKKGLDVKDPNSAFYQIPTWVSSPHVKGKITGVGISKANPGNDIALQMTEAESDGRDRIARSIETKVGNMLKTFKATTGSGASATYDRSTENVSKQVAKQSLHGTFRTKMWINEKTKDLFVLMEVDTKSAMDVINKSVKTSFGSDKALYQKFIAAKAQGDLKKELEAFNK